MKLSRLRADEVFEQVPPPWPEDLLPLIQESLTRKIIVLDDDPTGSQTVHGVPVLTNWSVDVLTAEFENALPMFFILTNSRSMTAAEAVNLSKEIGKNLLIASSGREFHIISRGDSALRGHFPNEVQALTDALNQEFDAWLLIPFFEEGGRLTIDDVHYVKEGKWLIPIAKTPYAQDAAFGFENSNLHDWVREKMGDVLTESISLSDVRIGGPDKVAQRLLNLPQGSVCIVNALSRQDLNVFTMGLIAAENEGRKFLYRTAASFVAARAGIPAKPLLSKDELNLPANCSALYVVGSYVPKTTAQIEYLIENTDFIKLELDVGALLTEEGFQRETERVAMEANRLLGQCQNVVIVTSRELITGTDPAGSLKIGARISDGLITIVGMISMKPKYWLSKGGITSSDIATEGLGVDRAMVLGQISPGVPVWCLGEEARFPGMVYIVFPGNVGDVDALAKVKERLS